MRISIDVDPDSGMASVRCDTAIDRIMLLRILLKLASNLASEDDGRAIVSPGGIPVGRGVFRG